MVFAPGCARGPAETSCDAADRKAGSASRRDRRFVSLRHRTDFQRVFRLGRRRRIPGLTVLTLDGPSEVPRVGIVAGKKVGNAVSRNRAKRRLREAAYRARLESYADYILIAEPGCNDVGFGDLIEAISGRTSGA